MTSCAGAIGRHTDRSSNEPRGDPGGNGGGVPCDGALGAAGAVVVCEGWLNEPAGPAGRTGPSPDCITEAEKAEKDGEASMSTMIQRIR